MTKNWNVRQAREDDLLEILTIYNQGIEDRIATLEQDLKSIDDMNHWFHHRPERYSVLVIGDEKIRGWASLNPYSHRCVYDGVADISIYIERSWRGKGLGSILLSALEEKAKENEFYKLVLFTFPFNQSGQNLYRKKGFREVGIFEKQGVLDGKFVDVMAMEKLLI